MIELFPIPIPYEQTTFLVRLCATIFSHLFVTMSKPQTENMAKHFEMTCWDLSSVAFDNWIYNILYARKCCRTADKNVQSGQNESTTKSIYKHTASVQHIIVVG